MSSGRGALRADARSLTAGRRDRKRENSAAIESRFTVKSFSLHRLWRRHRDTPARASEISSGSSIRPVVGPVSWRSSPPWHRHCGGGRLRPFGARESDPWSRGAGRGISPVILDDRFDLFGGLGLGRGGDFGAILHAPFYENREGRCPNDPVPAIRDTVQPGAVTPTGR